MDLATTLSPSRVEEALRLIDPVFLDSPQYASDALSDQVGAEVHVKIECLNPVRSFKGRGADYFAHRHRDSAEAPWVCASAGNFGQGLAYSARKHEIALIVFAAVNANPFKLERMRRLGAEVRLVGDDFDAAKDEARRYAAAEGLTFVEDGRDAAITEGAATIAPELLRGPPLDAVFVPVGNGALVNGVGGWMRSHSPRTRVIGVGVHGAPAMERSYRAGRVVTTETVSTIADGIATRVPVPEAVEQMRARVDEMLLVDDAELACAMAGIERELGIRVEPAGAATLAAAQVHRGSFADQRIALVVSGSNVTES